MEIRRLRYFVSVAEAGSMSRAASLLGIAQPAISRQVQILEQEVGVPLFVRSRSGMHITPAGMVLRAAVKGPLRELEFAIEEVRLHCEVAEHSMVIGMPTTVSTILALPLAKVFAEEMPNTRLRIVEGHPCQLLDMLGNSEIDTAFSYGPSPDESFWDSDMLVENLVLVGPSGSQLSSKGEIAFRDLYAYPLILPSFTRGIRNLLNKTSSRYKTKLNIISEIDSLSLTKSMVIDGMGFSVQPQSAIMAELMRDQLECAEIKDPTIKLHLMGVSRSHNQGARTVYMRMGKLIRKLIKSLVLTGVWPAELMFEADESLWRFDEEIGFKDDARKAAA